jgi:hypothetical protein
VTKSKSVIVVVVAVVACLAVIMLAIALLGGYFLIKNGGLPTNAPEPPGIGEVWEPSDDADGKIARLMAQGAQHDGHGRYYNSAGRYYKVIKLDSIHPEARRRGYLACENIAFDVLADDLMTRDVNARAMRREVRAALAQGGAAVDGRANVAETYDLVHALATKLPANDELTTMAQRLKRAATDYAKSDEGVAHQEAVGTKVQDGFAALAEGDLDAAESAFNAAVEADPDRQTPQSFRARDGLHAVEVARNYGG